MSAMIDGGTTSKDRGADIILAPSGELRLRWTKEDIRVVCGDETLAIVGRGGEAADGACAQAAAMLAVEVLRARPWLLRGAPR